MMLTTQDVISAYRLVLGREPESTALVEKFVAHSDFDRLRKILLGSGEFAERLQRHPDSLGMSMVALSISAEIRAYRRSLETLVALALPLWDQSVLIVGDAAASLAPFFLDRLCRVAIAASPETRHFLEMTLAALDGAANATLLDGGLAGLIERDAEASYDVVYAEMPETTADGMRAWLDDAAEVCGETLILSCTLAPGLSEEVFVTHDRKNAGFDAGFVAVPTHKWVVARLAERFGRVYVPRFAHALASTREGAAREERALLVAARQAPNGGQLTECVLDAVKPRKTRGV